MLVLGFSRSSRYHIEGTVPELNIVFFNALCVKSSCTDLIHINVSLVRHIFFFKLHVFSLGAISNYCYKVGKRDYSFLTFNQNETHYFLSFKSNCIHTPFFSFIC